MGQQIKYIPVNLHRLKIIIPIQNIPMHSLIFTALLFSKEVFRIFYLFEDIPIRAHIDFCVSSPKVRGIIAIYVLTDIAIFKPYCVSLQR